MKWRKGLPITMGKRDKVELRSFIAEKWKDLLEFVKEQGECRRLLNNQHHGIYKNR